MKLRQIDNNSKRLKRTSARDIYPIPPCKSIINRVKCDQSLLYFLKYNFPERFYKPFGPAHLQYIQNLQRIIQNGGLQAIGCSRSSGKSVIAQLAVLWACVTGKRQYSLFVALSAKKAKQANKAVYKALQTNDKLLQLYPQACYPIRCLQGSAGRARGQLYKGKPTGLQFGKLICLAAVGGVSDNCVININSITSGIRGQAAVRADGTYIRPSLCIIDDVVNDQTANSPQVQQGLQDIIENSIMFLAGVGNKMSVALIGTIVGKHDIMAKYLDKKQKPLWNGIKMPALYSMPKNMQLWQAYKELYIIDINNGDQILSNQYYLQNRQKMDDGALSSWQSRLQDKDISAIQHAMRKWAENPQSFYKQYQLSPQEKVINADRLKYQDIQISISELKQGQRPAQEHKIFIGMDINQPAISWVVAAYTKNCIYIIDYGFCPDSPQRYFRMGQHKMPLRRRFPANSLNESIKLGLDYIVGQLSKKYNPDVLLIDRGHAKCISQVTQIAQKYKNLTGDIYLSAKGHAFGARVTTTFADGKVNKQTINDKNGLWRLHLKTVNGAFLLHETDLNKSQVAEKFKNNMVKLFNPNIANNNYHRLFIQHCISQYPTTVQAAGGVKTVWDKDKKYGGQDHLWDAFLLTNIGSSLINHKQFKSYKKPQKNKQVKKEIKNQPRINFQF